MKICMLTSGHYALDSRVFSKEAASLRKIYNDVSIVAVYEKEFDEVDNIKIYGIKKAKSLYERYKLVDKVIDKAIELKADVYHFHDFEMILKIMRIKKALPNCRLIYDVHEYYPEMVTMSKKIPGILKPFGEIYVKKKEDSIIKKFDYVITTDDYNKERFSKIVPYVEVVYNFSEFNPNEKPADEKLYDIIYQGGISIERGAMMLVKAVKIAQKKIPDIKYIMVGSFDDKEAENSVMNYIKENKLEKNINYIGRVPHSQVKEYIEKSKMGVVAFLPYPRYAKNIPIKQFEYMSCGVPVIGGNLPSVKKFVEKYNSGIIVNPEDPEDMANAIVNIIENPELAKQLSLNGLKAVKEEYNWSNMEKRLWNIYKSLENK